MSVASEASIANSNVFTFQFQSKSEIRFNSKKFVDNFTHFFFSQKLHKSIFGWFNKRLKRTKKTGSRVPREKCEICTVSWQKHILLSTLVQTDAFFIIPRWWLIGDGEGRKMLQKKAPSSKNRKLRRAYISLCLLSI